MALILFRLLPPVMLVMKIAMLVDALRRNPYGHWVPVILFAPFGEFIYYGMVVYPRSQAAQRRARPYVRAPRRTAPDPGPLEPAQPSDLSAITRLLDQQAYADAAALLEPLLDAEPDHPAHRFLQGRVLAGLSDHAGAAQQFKYAALHVRGDKKTAALFRLATSLEALGRSEEAILALRDAVAARPTPETRYTLAKGLIAGGRADEWRTVLQMLLDAAERSAKQGFGNSGPWVDRAKTLLRELD
jgi:hypothetical protein